MPRNLLAEGELNWVTEERKSDRYGTVSIQTGGEYVRTFEDLLKDLPAEYAQFTDAPVGALGRLVAEVTVTRDSYHLGDMFRGLRPVTPNVGDEITLGEGELFVATLDDIPVIGVLPDDGRSTDWMDPRQLYRVHAQTVMLYFDSE